MSDQGSNQGNQGEEEHQEFFFGNLPLEYVVSVILGQGNKADTPLRKAFCSEGIDEYPNLLSMSQEDVENLCYHEEENGKPSDAVLIKASFAMSRSFLTLSNGEKWKTTQSPTSFNWLVPRSMHFA